MRARRFTPLESTIRVKNDTTCFQHRVRSIMLYHGIKAIRMNKTLSAYISNFLTGFTVLLSIILLSGVLVSYATAPNSHPQTAFVDNHGWLGLNVRDSGQGIEVVDVYMNSPAQTAGIKKGDIITEIDNRKVTDTRTLLSRLSDKRPEHVKIKIMRNEEDIELIPTSFSPTGSAILSVSPTPPAPRPEDFGIRGKSERVGEAPTYRRGTTISAAELVTKYQEFIEKALPTEQMGFTVVKKTVTKELDVPLASVPKIVRLLTLPKPEIRGDKAAGWMGISTNYLKDLGKWGSKKWSSGIKVTMVSPFSPADKGGLERDDVIVQYDGISFSVTESGQQEKFTPLEVPSPASAGSGAVASGDLLLTGFTDYIKAQGSGAAVSLTVLRGINEIRLNDREIIPLPDDIQEIINKCKVGEQLKTVIAKNVHPLKLKVVLGTRMMAENANAPEPEPNDKIHPELVSYTTPIEQLTHKILDETKIRDKYDDLLKRYQEDEKLPDVFRLRDLRYLHRDPFKIPRVCDDFVGQLRETVSKQIKRIDHPDVTVGAFTIMDAISAKLTAVDSHPDPNTNVSGEGSPRFFVPQSGTQNDTSCQLKTGLSLEEHCNQLLRLMEEADKYRKQAFAGLTQDDYKFLKDNIMGFTERWLRDFHFSNPYEIKQRGAIDKRVLQLCGYVNYQPLFLSGKVMAQMVSPDYLNGLKKDIEIACGNKAGILFTRDTRFGKIIISGQGNSQYLYRDKTEDAVIIIDLGGDDFYANSPRQFGQEPIEHPFSVVIDFGGNDRYSSYENGCQGCGIMGVSILADMGGDDTYIAQNWAQGSGLLGVGILLDSGGHDIYKGQEFVQGAGLFGIGVLIDVSTNSKQIKHPDNIGELNPFTENSSDSYQANQFAQGFAGPKACGLLIDTAGNDSYFASGKYPNGYREDVGTFSGWSQGCGTGFRCYADWSMSRSGGIGILIDEAGSDYYEAGTFSQGGGYFFGWGMLYDAGDGDDEYLGTRYAQGFAAHSALGYFVDEGGNDHYRTQAGVNAGLSWDLTGVVFIDKGGDDVYEESGFSVCATAHNGFCLFMDLGGKDVYKTKPGGRANPNTYHGGYSLSVFLDQGPEENTYTKPPDGFVTDPEKPFSICVNKEYSIFINTRIPVEELLKDDAYKTNIKNNVKEEGSSQ